jgi:bifunctional non-homologous end joining protein LigD
MTGQGMGLKDYFRKRSFKETPEPRGGLKRGKSKKLAFVIQEHHATALHYDFRLEIDGVLVSWAVPKGPSLDPHEHHLAIRTEDHPFEYRKFEGVIPKGQYGAGNVIIWDEGWYEARKGELADSEATMRTELKKGHVTFILHGKKLNGEFALIKLRNSDDPKAWLLVKKGDEYASTQDVTKQDESVLSHKHVDDLGGKVPILSDYPKKARPWHVKPMLCTLVDEPFDREGWLFEIKWDGYRAVASKRKDKVELYSRNGLDFAQKYAPVAEALRSIAHDVILDGEIVVVDGDGKPHFEWLQGWHKQPQGNLKFYAFDILWCDGRDVRSMPLTTRKALLKNILPSNEILQYSDHIETAGKKLFEQMKKQNLEGMIAKRADSPYREDVRGQDWLKVKTGYRQEVVIGGYTAPQGSRKYFGSLLVGVFENSELVYSGHSGGGIPDEDRKNLLARLQKLARKSSPFKTEPKPNAPVQWVRPQLVCEMSFAEWTSDNMMRHPQFEGLRPDKKPTDVAREKPHNTKTMPVKNPGGLPFELTHPDKVFFPKTKYTKGDLVKYYEAVAEYMLPYLSDRPHSLIRMPSGIDGESFYQKNNPHLPDWVPHKDIFSESNNENLRWMVGGDLSTLLYMVQLGCVEINPWNSRVGSLDHPDWIVIDLDPDGNDFEEVIEIARTVHEVCEEWGVPTHPKTSGKSGIHIYIPMGAKYTYEQGKNLAHLIVLEVHKRTPKITSVERMPEKRKRKIYLDYLQNREGQTLAAPYSVRPTPEATVSMPLHWSEIKPGLKPTDFTIQNALKRIKKNGDIFDPVLAKPIDLKKVLKNIPQFS